MERLHSEQTVECLVAQAREADYEKIRGSESPYEAAKANAKILEDSVHALQTAVREINAGEYSAGANAKATRLLAIAKPLLGEWKLIIDSLDSLSKVDVDRKPSPKEMAALNAYTSQNAKCELATRKYQSFGR